MSWPIFRVESSKRGGSANFAVFFAFCKYFLSEFCNGNSRVNTKSCIPKRSWQARISLLDRFLQKSTVLRPENTKGEGCHPGWSLPPQTSNVSEHNSRNRLSAVWPRLAATCNFLELRSQGVANSRRRQPPLSGGRPLSASEPSPRDPQSRGACRGATSLRTRNAAVLPAAQRYGVSARGPVPGGEGKYDRRVLTQQQRQGLLASENGSCFCWKPHYSHRSVEGYRCCFL